MLLTEAVSTVKPQILVALRSAAAKSEIHQGIQLELNAIEEGLDPKDVLGMNWGAMIAFGWHNKSESELVEFFNRMAHG